MTKNVLITTSSFQLNGNEYLTRLRQADFEVILNPYKRRLSEEEINGLLREHEPVGMIAGVEPLTAAVIGSAKSLKVISRCGVGTDSVDLEAAEASGIPVTITPGGPTAAVSELTLSLMLAACRRVVEADRNVRSGEWGALMGRLLARQVVGLIGFGRIGQAVAGLCQAFGATVIASDPIASSSGDVLIQDVESVLSQADIVSLHVPLTDETRGLLNAERIASMKPGSILINAARGDLVDEAALHDALKSGHLAAAALDCFVDEPYEGPLRGCPTAILTAHMGSYAREARALMEQEAAQNLVEQLEALSLLDMPG